MASQLHRAVELAQAGRREEARQVFLTYLQDHPDNEVAWLWLASVAATQAEYQHALNQVLRINPANERAQRLLEEFQRQQYGPGPSAAPPAPSYPPPSAPAYTPRPVPPVQQGPVYPPPYASEPRPEPAWRPVEPPVQPQPVEVKVKQVGGRRGCMPGLGCGPGCLGCAGCGGPGCLLTPLILIIVPFVILAILTYRDNSLSLADWAAVYLPDEFGRKMVTLQTDSTSVAVKVPRSWYLAAEGNESWTAARAILDAAVPFTDDARTWADFEVMPNQQVIVETNPITLIRAGDVITLAYQGPVDGDFACGDVRNQQTNAEKIYEYGTWCGYRNTETRPGPGTEVLRAVDPPAHERVISFVVPTSTTTGSSWQLQLPEEAYAQFQDDIDVLIESVQVQAK